MCGGCGAFNPAGGFFCQHCGKVLDGIAWIPACPTPATPTQEGIDGLEVFWEKRKREVGLNAQRQQPEINTAPPPQPYAQSASPNVAKGRPLLWFSLLISLLLLVALAVGVYLLVRLL
jgi:hypothetical protein